jgi:hypothetical protein
MVRIPIVLAAMLVLGVSIPPAVVLPCAAPLRQSFDVSDVLDHVSDYLTTFAQDYSRVIAEERYRQTLRPKRIGLMMEAGATQTREIQSDIIAAPDTGHRWLSFRDVYSVDGKAVRNRDTRLQRLFEKPGANRFEDARRIADEGARFNLGSLSRNINLPSMPLTFGARENRSRSTFRITGRDTIDGVEVLMLRFQETARPTLVKSGPRDIPAQGTFWIEPLTGRVMKASAKFEAIDFTTEMTVTFGLIDKLQAQLPVGMTDVSENSREVIEGVAAYTNYRRFETSVVIK